MRPKVLVVDDDRQIVRLLVGYLEQYGFKTLTAHDGVAALAVMRAEQPDLVLLDVMLPGIDGLDIAQAARAEVRLADIPIIMLTAWVEDADKVVGLELGADDYVTKPFNPREVVARVKAVLRRSGRAPTAPTALGVGDLTLDVDRREVKVRGELVELTQTEFDMLERLMRRPGRVLTRVQLLEVTRDGPHGGTERTVDSHIRNLRRKLAQSPGAPPIETVFGVGYKLPPP